MTKTVIIKRDGRLGPFDKCRRLLGACSLVGGAGLELIEAADVELDRLEALADRSVVEIEADARALWAYRVVNEQAKRDDRDAASFADEAELIAHATALVAADPSLDPDTNSVWITETWVRT